MEPFPVSSRRACEGVLTVKNCPMIGCRGAGPAMGHLIDPGNKVYCRRPPTVTATFRDTRRRKFQRRPCAMSGCSPCDRRGRCPVAAPAAYRRDRARRTPRFRRAALVDPQRRDRRRRPLLDRCLAAPRSRRPKRTHAVDMAEAVDPAGHQIGCATEGANPTFAPITTGPMRCFHRRCTTRRTAGTAVRRGQWCGREDRAWPRCDRTRQP